MRGAEGCGVGVARLDGLKCGVERIPARVSACDIIGHVGADPLDGEGLMHLHLELWYRGARESAIDPAPLMTTWLIAPASVSLVAST